ncbi:MAG: hypothetical protein QNJ34_02925 [Xenococcaceae cyanobacterium MO_188.B29]|nr:hypothetical protein [Xenococcaceae cyanobacterium MO_188.B29]
MYGGAGNDTLTGGRGRDTLFGETGGDELHGGGGGDFLIGGVGRDVLTGGRGSDVFVLAAGEGRDTITDFTVDVDKIGLFGSGDVRFNDLDFEGHSIIFGSETLAILTGVDTTTLTADDFDLV